MRSALLMFVVAGCAPAAVVHYDFRYAAARAAHQTVASEIEVRPDDPEEPYVVLGDIEITLQQQSMFGEVPTPELVDAELRRRAAQLGAHAVILVSYGRLGNSLFSSSELRGHGRAIRFR